MVGSCIGGDRGRFAVIKELATAFEGVDKDEERGRWVRECQERIERRRRGERAPAQGDEKVPADEKV